MTQRRRFKAPRSIHGKSRTKIYGVWLNMHRRCTDPTVLSFKNYGLRGIAVDPRWLVFQNFYDDMGDKPSPAHSLERIDNDANYSPKNCRWATAKEQAQNRRTNKIIDYNGEKIVLAELARRFNICDDTLISRLNNNWPIERSLKEPAWNQKTITLDKITLTIPAWAKKTGISRRTICDRLSKGWDAKRILTKIRHGEVSLGKVVE